MLVLTRKTGEEIIIGTGDNAIRVKVRILKGNRVSIGIAAPRDTTIRRGELDTTTRKKSHD